MKAARYVITCAQNATPVHAGFLAALKQYCKRNGSTLVVVPTRYKNPTSLWSEAQEHDDWWAPEVVRYLRSDRHDLAKGCTLLADIKIQPTADDPLSGLEGMTGARSVIVGHPQVALTHVATPQDQLARALYTTGACTVANYSPTKAGAKGAHHHSIAALVVEIDKKGIAHIRHVSAVEDGSFHDLDREYHPKGSRANGGVATLTMGDTHADFVDPLVRKATFVGPQSMVHALRPQFLVWHDVFDCYSGSHHHRHSPLTQFKKHHSGRNNVGAELKRCFEFVDKHSPAWCQNVFVPSNHVDHLFKWLEETDPRADHENGLLWAELYLATRTQDVEPFVYMAQKNLRCADRSIFLGRDESFTVHGVDHSLHGDIGPNGARGSIKALAKTAGKCSIGHSHTSGIRHGCFQAGTSTIYRLEYAKGPSSWTQSHIVEYRNGKRAILHVIDGRYRG